MLKLSVEEIRYLARHQTDQTVTRQHQHPVWEKVSEVILYATAMHQSGLLPDQMIDVKRNVIIQRQLGLLLSSAVSLTVAIGVGEHETIKGLTPRVAADNLRALIEQYPEKFEVVAERAQSRYHFILKNEEIAVPDDANGKF